MTEIKCPNCGKTKTVDSPHTINRRAVINEVYAYTGNSLRAVKYTCKDTRFWMGNNIETNPGCGCEWVVGYEVSVKEKDMAIIERGKEK